MTLYASGYREVDVDLEVEDDEILEYIQEDEKRLAHFRQQLQVPSSESARALLDSMSSIDRDRFLADLCRECVLLGIEWPADPRAETQRITK